MAGAGTTIRRPGPEAVGNRPKEQHPEAGAERESPERHSCHQRTDEGDDSRMQLLVDTVAQKAGDDRHEADGHGNQPAMGDTDPQFRMHQRPCGSQDRIREPKTDEGKIDDCQ